MKTIILKCFSKNIILIKTYDEKCMDLFLGSNFENVIF